MARQRLGPFRPLNERLLIPETTKNRVRIGKGNKSWHDGKRQEIVYSSSNSRRTSMLYCSGGGDSLALLIVGAGELGGSRISPSSVSSSRDDRGLSLACSAGCRRINSRFPALVVDFLATGVDWGFLATRAYWLLLLQRRHGGSKT